MSLTPKTVTRSALIEVAARRVDCSKSDAALVTRSMFEMIGRTLTEGEAVKLASFGSFQIRSRGPRLGRNPRTGDQHPIASHLVIMFVPSWRLKNVLDSAWAARSKRKG